MHYDLYGNSYETELEALNAEMAQCAQIDARLQQDTNAKLEQENYNLQYELNCINERLSIIEDKIKLLEQKIK